MKDAKGNSPYYLNANDKGDGRQDGLLFKQ
jgi:hypothetical protein